MEEYPTYYEHITSHLKSLPDEERQDYIRAVYDEAFDVNKSFAFGMSYRFLMENAQGLGFFIPKKFVEEIVDLSFGKDAYWSNKLFVIQQVMEIEGISKPKKEELIWRLGDSIALYDDAVILSTLYKEWLILLEANSLLRKEKAIERRQKIERKLKVKNLKPIINESMLPELPEGGFYTDIVNRLNKKYSEMFGIEINNNEHMLAAAIHITALDTKPLDFTLSDYSVFANLFSVTLIDAYGNLISHLKNGHDIYECCC